MNDDEFVILEEEIVKRVKELAQEINTYYIRKKINFINVLFISTGAFIFTSDLIRELNVLGLKMKTSEIMVHSYYGTDSGTLELKEDDFCDLDLKNSHLLMIDDILDTGRTLATIKKKILEIYEPSSIEICVFLKKQIEEKKLGLDIKFVGFTIPNIFVVGYGLDYNGEYRELPYIIDFNQLNRD